MLTIPIDRMTGETHGANSYAIPTQQDDIDLNNLDVVLIGAGFAGTLLLWRLRAMGFKTHLVERHAQAGGVWAWNTSVPLEHRQSMTALNVLGFSYPGARVDSDVPAYELTDPELWNDWK